MFQVGAAGLSQTNHRSVVDLYDTGLDIYLYNFSGSRGRTRRLL
jgi:hypothetical protein